MKDPPRMKFGPSVGLDWAYPGSAAQTTFAENSSYIVFNPVIRVNAVSPKNGPQEHAHLRLGFPSAGLFTTRKGDIGRNIWSQEVVWNRSWLRHCF